MPTPTAPPPDTLDVPANRVCPASTDPKVLRCHARIVSNGRGALRASVAPPSTAKVPADLWSAYKNTPAVGSPGSLPVIAIVDAFGYPNAERDLNVYRSQFGLGSCTTGNGCFRKINQRGVQGSYPAFDAGWAQESALDVQMVSAMCPNCKILLVEADTNSFQNLAASVDEAATYTASGWPVAVAISNSYGGAEYWSETYTEAHFNHPGIAITASSGDNGFGAEFPAASRYVIAVGGTRLVRDGSTRGWSETAWSGTGAGCSQFIAKPAWQHDGGCAKRTIGDVAAVADPSTGVAVYAPTDAVNSTWFQFGGTSVGAPLIAALYGLRAVGLSYPASGLYEHCVSLFDIVSGSDGSCGTYLCTAKVGYDGPTGNGTPNGITAF